MVTIVSAASFRCMSEKSYRYSVVYAGTVFMGVTKPGNNNGISLSISVKVWNMSQKSEGPWNRTGEANAKHFQALL